MTASVQPSHAMDDRDLADRAWGARAAAAYRWRDLLDAGADLAFGSDAPVAELDPLAGIQAAVHRTSDEREPWYPAQGLDVADAVLGFTAGAAHAVGDHRRRGLLLPGYAADLVVLDTDIIAHPDRIGRGAGGGDDARRPLGARRPTLVNVNIWCQAPNIQPFFSRRGRRPGCRCSARTRARSSRSRSCGASDCTWRNSPAASWPSLIQKKSRPRWKRTSGFCWVCVCDASVAQRPNRRRRVGPFEPEHGHGHLLGHPGRDRARPPGGPRCSAPSRSLRSRPAASASQAAALLGLARTAARSLTSERGCDVGGK